MDPNPDINLMYMAMSGDEVAAKIYCGSYMLIYNPTTKEKYRFQGEIIPDGFVKVEGVYDLDGLLLSEYWALPRLGRK